MCSKAVYLALNVARRFLAMEMNNAWLVAGSRPRICVSTLLVARLLHVVLRFQGQGGRGGTHTNSAHFCRSEITRPCAGESVGGHSQRKALKRQ